MSQALASRNIKIILDEYERTGEWFFKTYQKEPTTFARYNDKLDRFEVTFTAPLGTKYIESSSYIEGTKLYDHSYVKDFTQNIFPNLKRAILHKIETEEKQAYAKKEIEKAILGKENL